MKKIIMAFTMMSLVLLTTGCTNLTTELRRGNMEVANKMIENKQGLNDFEFETGLTPLLYSIKTKKYEITKKLIENEADLNLWDGVSNQNYIRPNLRTPLLESILGDDEKKLEVIELLLKNSAKIDIESDIGITPMMAALSKDKEIIKLLLKYNGNINFKNKYGGSVIFYAEKLEDIKYLLENGADINIKDNNGRNLMMRENIPLDIIKYLVKMGIDIKAIDNEGRNMLFYSINDKEKMEYFLSLGLRNTKDKDGWGLYTYVKYKNPKILDVLSKYNIKKDDEINYEIPNIPENKALIIIKRPAGMYGSLNNAIVEFAKGKELDLNNGYSGYFFIDAGKEFITTHLKKKVLTMQSEVDGSYKEFDMEFKAGKIYYLEIKQQESFRFYVENKYNYNLISQEEKKLIAEISNKEIVEITETNKEKTAQSEKN